MKLRKGEFIRFFRNFIVILKEDESYTSKFDDKLNPLVAELDKMDIVFTSNKKSEFTEELKKADRLRKEAIIGIRKFANANTYHFNTNVQASAKLILRIIKKFSNTITLQDKHSRTASITNVITALKQDRNSQNAVTMLQLNEWVNKLNETNQAFKQVFHKSIEKKSQESKDKIKELRQQASNYYYELRDYINANYILNKESFSPAVAKLNQLIKQYNTLVNRRKGKSKRKRPSTKEKT